MTVESPPVETADFLHKLRVGRKTLRRFGFSLRAFLLGCVLAVFIAAFEALSVALLVPLIRGLVQLDFRLGAQGGILRILEAAFPGSTNSSNAVFFILLVFLFLASAAKNLLQYLSIGVMAGAGARFSDILRQRIFERYLQFGKLVFDNKNAGHFHALLMRQTSAIAREMVELQGAMNQSFTLMAYLSLMFILSWQLTLVVLLMFPVLHFGLNRALNGIKNSSEAQVRSQADLDGQVFNTLSCMPLFKAYSMEGREHARFARISGAVSGIEMRIARLRGLLWPVQEFLLLLMLMLLMGFMTYLARRQGAGSVPAFLVYFYVLKKAATSFTFWNTFRMSILSVFGPINEIQALFEDHDKAFVPDGTKPFPGLASRMECRGLSFSYGSGPVLSGIDLSFEKGNLTALVGPSGAGKSTIINLLMRFYDPPPASIFFDGVDIREFKLQSLLGKIALVSQDAWLFNDSVRANLAYGFEGVSDQKLMDVLDQARLKETVVALPRGLDTPIGDHGARFSAGERQRLSIARAILKSPEILILDEATSALDSKTEQLIQEAISELIKGKTVIVIAHRLATIKHADHVVVIEGGRVAETGRFDELIQKAGRFRVYWEAQNYS